MNVAAQWFALAAGAWLIGLGVWMAVSPRKALSALGAMGGTPRVHFGEMAVRALVGVALVVAAPVSRYPAAIALIGGFLVVSALALSLLPRRWHSAYSRWWAERIPPWAVRLVGPLSVVGGGVLIWCLV